jgi:DNA-directed RNA polymerase subunit H (RpoH/RPB5)
MMVQDVSATVGGETKTETTQTFSTKAPQTEVARPRVWRCWPAGTPEADLTVVNGASDKAQFYKCACANLLRSLIVYRGLRKVEDEAETGAEVGPKTEEPEEKKRTRRGKGRTKKEGAVERRKEERRKKRGGKEKERTRKGVEEAVVETKAEMGAETEAAVEKRGVGKAAADEDVEETEEVEDAKAEAECADEDEGTKAEVDKEECKPQRKNRRTETASPMTAHCAQLRGLWRRAGKGAGGMPVELTGLGGPVSLDAWPAGLAGQGERGGRNMAVGGQDGLDEPMVQGGQGWQGEQRLLVLPLDPLAPPGRLSKPMRMREMLAQYARPGSGPAPDVLVITDTLNHHTSNFAAAALDLRKQLGVRSFRITTWDAFALDPLVHVSAVKRPRIATKTEVGALCREFRLDKHNLPQLADQDPVAMFLGAEVGAVVRYFAQQEGGMGFCHRVVVPSPVAMDRVWRDKLRTATSERGPHNRVVADMGRPA